MDVLLTQNDGQDYPHSLCFHFALRFFRRFAHLFFWAAEMCFLAAALNL